MTNILKSPGPNGAASLNGNGKLLEPRLTKTELEDKTGLVGDTPIMQDLQNKILLVAKTNLNVLLIGEPGTGKELVAKAIHSNTSKKSGQHSVPFVIVNCPAILETLIESELFGYTRGSFTGASPSGHSGKLRMANGGTIFFDEISALELGVQAKLLRFMQEREISMIGSTTNEKISARTISATNKNLRKMVEDSKFRSDFHDRLNEFAIILPNISQRTEDIPRLVQHFTEKHKPPAMELLGIAPEVVEFLQSKKFSGNIRELEHCVKSAVQMEFATAVTKGDTDKGNVLGLRYIEVHNFAEAPKDTTLPKENALPVGGKVPLWLNANGDGFFAAEHGLTLHETVEKQLFMALLRRHDGNRRLAAKVMGISYRTSTTLSNKYGLGEMSAGLKYRSNGESNGS